MTYLPYRLFSLSNISVLLSVNQEKSRLTEAAIRMWIECLPWLWLIGTLYCREVCDCQICHKGWVPKLQKTHHSSEFQNAIETGKILCSMLPLQRNADINWKSHWYVNCCDLMDLQNNALNMNVLCAVSIVPGFWVQFVPANRLTACKCMYLFFSITTQRYSYRTYTLLKRYTL